ncbi:hypothetical protein ElyMa_003358300 [Elysia marginata]|uniref:CCHC-type domain-containing protein n=1 Tax=Elysia marginata TaxID=1093978 RepID=A0AAV4JJF1_9GAST|nr:hypothetical protein ElyMa_003358300 [Elysia marginata]
MTDTQKLYKGWVTHVTDPGSFWMQIGTDNGFDSFRVYQVTMDDFYNSNGDDHVVAASDLFQGACVVVRKNSNYDQFKWRRARVSRVSDDGDWYSVTHSMLEEDLGLPNDYTYGFEKSISHDVVDRVLLQMNMEESAATSEESQEEDQISSNNGEENERAVNETGHDAIQDVEGNKDIEDLWEDTDSDGDQREDINKIWQDAVKDGKENEDVQEVWDDTDKNDEENEEIWDDSLTKDFEEEQVVKDICEDAIELEELEESSSEDEAGDGKNKSNSATGSLQHISSRFPEPENKKENQLFKQSDFMAASSQDSIKGVGIPQFNIKPLSQTRAVCANDLQVKVEEQTQRRTVQALQNDLHRCKEDFEEGLKLSTNVLWGRSDSQVGQPHYADESDLQESISEELNKKSLGQVNEMEALGQSLNKKFQDVRKKAAELPVSKVPDAVKPNKSPTSQSSPGCTSKSNNERALTEEESYHLEVKIEEILKNKKNETPEMLRVQVHDIVPADKTLRPDLLATVMTAVLESIIRHKCFDPAVALTILETYTGADAFLAVLHDTLKALKDKFVKVPKHKQKCNHEDYASLLAMLFIQSQCWSSRSVRVVLLDILLNNVAGDSTGISHVPRRSSTSVGTQTGTVSGRGTPEVVQRNSQGPFYKAPRGTLYPRHDPFTPHNFQENSSDTLDLFGSLNNFKPSHNLDFQSPNFEANSVPVLHSSFEYENQQTSQSHSNCEHVNDIGNQSLASTFGEVVKKADSLSSLAAGKGESHEITLVTGQACSRRSQDLEQEEGGEQEAENLTHANPAVKRMTYTPQALKAMNPMNGMRRYANQLKEPFELKHIFSRVEDDAQGSEKENLPSSSRIASQRYIGNGFSSQDLSLLSSNVEAYSIKPLESCGGNKPKDSLFPANINVNASSRNSSHSPSSVLSQTVLNPEENFQPSIMRSVEMEDWTHGVIVQAETQSNTHGVIEPEDTGKEREGMTVKTEWPDNFFLNARRNIDAKDEASSKSHEINQENPLAVAGKKKKKTKFRPLEEFLDEGRTYGVDESGRESDEFDEFSEEALKMYIELENEGEEKKIQEARMIHGPRPCTSTRSKASLFAEARKAKTVKSKPWVPGKRKCTRCGSESHIVSECSEGTINDMDDMSFMF